MRPKALSDAKGQALSLENVRGAAGYSSVSATEGCMRGFELKEVNFGLAIPKARLAV